MDAREGEEHVLLPLLQCDVPYDVQRSRMCLFQEAPPAPLSRGPCREDDPAGLVGSKCHNSSGCCPRRLETTKMKRPRTGGPRRVMKNCARFALFFGSLLVSSPRLPTTLDSRVIIKSREPPPRKVQKVTTSVVPTQIVNPPPSSLGPSFSSSYPGISPRNAYKDPSNVPAFACAFVPRSSVE